MQMKDNVEIQCILPLYSVGLITIAPMIKGKKISYKQMTIVLYILLMSPTGLYFRLLHVVNCTCAVDGGQSTRAQQATKSMIDGDKTLQVNGLKQLLLAPTSPYLSGLTLGSHAYHQ